MIRALHRKLRQRGFAGRRCVRQKIHDVLRRAPTEKLLDRGSPATRYDLRFSALPIVCTWHQRVRLQLVVVIGLAVCTALNIVTTLLEATDQLPSVQRQAGRSVSGYGDGGWMRKVVNERRRPVD